MRYVQITKPEVCPFCGKKLRAGVCVCSGCGAQHVTNIKPLNWFLGTFIVTIIFTSVFVGEALFGLGAVLGVAFGVLAQWVRDSSAEWTR